MAVKKHYANAEYYERKLERVMERLKAENVNYDWTRSEAWITFTYKGEFYRFEHSVQRARERGIELRYGSDAFAQLVLALEDLARLVERGIYDLARWIAGLKALPEGQNIPECFVALGFDRIPSGSEEVKKAFAALVKQAHPDNRETGSEERFKALVKYRDEALKYLEERR